MSRLVIAAALVFAVGVPMHAQRGMRGVGGARVAMGRSAPPMGIAPATQRQFFAPHPAMMTGSRVPFAPQRRSVMPFAHINSAPIFRTHAFGSRFDHGFHRRRVFVVASPYYYRSYWPYYYSDYGYPYYSFSSYSSEPAPANNSSYADLSNQMSQLDSEVRQLRDENDSLRSALEEQRRPVAPPSPAGAKPADEPATVIVYRDGHRVEVQNYAIVGSTLWLLSNARATKVPLADLDINQTVKANEDRSVNFLVPK
ncbi:MAG: hypothetical protein DMG64_10865 [Acidobacteria bacterium]|nr:MAG: hypothetical protein DMG64_10865 [Acidobacteriota bacterium]